MKLKQLIKNMDKTLLFFTVLLFGFGLLNIVTASSREAVVVNKAGIYYYFYRQMAILGIGFICSIIVYLMPTNSYHRIWMWLYAIVFALICYCFFVSGKRGAQNWITILGFQFQPSELAKPLIIISLSVLFERFYSKLKDKKLAKDHKFIIGILLIVGFLAPVLIFLQKDLGTASIILGIVGTLFLASPILWKEKFKILKILIIVALLGCATLKLTRGYILSDEQKERMNYINPCNNYENGGYQICNAYIALNDGGLFGLGIGKSKQKYSYIPEPHTDSIFAIIGEEWGVIWCLFLVFIPYGIILYRIMDISSKANTIRGRYIALGVGTGIFLHIFINLGGLFAVIPFTGVPLPFLSYGGTYTLCLMISLALVQRVYYETKTKKSNI